MRFWTGSRALTGVLLLLVLSGTDPLRGVPMAELNGPRNAVPIEKLAHLTMVKAFINEKGPYDFVVDTGAGVTVLNSELVHDLKLPVVGTTEVGSPMGAEPIQADSFRLRSVRIGNAVVEDTPAIALDLQKLFGSLKAPDGILAAASFEGFLMT